MMPPEWVERYARHAENTRLPAGHEAWEARALGSGVDGAALLAAVYAPDTPAWLPQVSAVEPRRRVWGQNFSHSIETAAEPTFRAA